MSEELIKQVGIKLSWLDKTRERVFVVEVNTIGMPDEESEKSMRAVESLLTPTFVKTFGPVGDGYSVVYIQKDFIKIKGLTDEQLAEMGLQRIKKD